MRTNHSENNIAAPCDHIARPQGARRHCNFISKGVPCASDRFLMSTGQWWQSTSIRLKARSGECQGAFPSAVIYDLVSFCAEHYRSCHQELACAGSGETISMDLQDRDWLAEAWPWLDVPSSAELDRHLLVWLLTLIHWLSNQATWQHGRYTNQYRLRQLINSWCTDWCGGSSFNGWGHREWHLLQLLH